MPRYSNIYILGYVKWLRPVFGLGLILNLTKSDGSSVTKKDSPKGYVHFSCRHFITSAKCRFCNLSSLQFVVLQLCILQLGFRQYVVLQFISPTTWFSTICRSTTWYSTTWHSATWFSTICRSTIYQFCNLVFDI
jgi:hypothetical protein